MGRRDRKLMCGAASEAKFGTGHCVLGKSQGRGPGTPLCLRLSRRPWMREITVPHFSHCEMGALGTGACEGKMLLVKQPVERPTHPRCLRGSHCFPSKLLSGSLLSCPAGCCCWISCLCTSLACERRTPTLELPCPELGSARICEGSVENVQASGTWWLLLFCCRAAHEICTVVPEIACR